MLEWIVGLSEAFFYIVGIVLCVKLYKYATRDEADSKIYREDSLIYLQSIELSAIDIAQLLYKGEEVSGDA